jgi:hypothetical protein
MNPMEEEAYQSPRNGGFVPGEENISGTDSPRLVTSRSNREDF